MQSGPGLIPTFLYYFVATAAITAFVLGKGLDRFELDVIGNPLQLGILLGLVAGALGTYFNRHQQLVVPIKNRGAFLKQLNEVLAQMGYAEAEQVEDVHVYDRPPPSSFLSGRLFVQVEADTATLSGRISSIRALQKRLQA